MPVVDTPHATPIEASAAPAVRRGTPADAAAIHELIAANLADGHLLPRSLGEITVHARRFVVLESGDRIVGCAELAPLSSDVAEVRSLVIASDWRRRGLGSRLLEELRIAARREGFGTLCAFTHDPTAFVRLGFSIAPHVWFPEKIAHDCQDCPKFRTCGQYAVALPLRGHALRSGRSFATRVPASAGRRFEPAAAPRLALASRDAR